MKKLPSAHFMTTSSAAVLALFCATLTVRASVQAGDGVPASGQSSADPLGLPIVAPVMQVGSDAAAQQFAANLPSALNFVAANLQEGQNNSGNSSLFQLDPAKWRSYR